MSNSIGEYIEKLCAKQGQSQSAVARAINVPRQSLSYVICGKRELSLQLAMKLEAFFSLQDGELMQMQARQAVMARKRSIKETLCSKLIEKNAFWSHDIKSANEIPDGEIIEKSFIVLDMEDIDLMFEIYPRKQILKVWRERMAIQGEYMKMLNIMIAMYYFGIQQPEKYLARIEREHINKLLRHATGFDN
jgi:plasmid maintenance system antidote protein VapI